MLEVRLVTGRVGAANHRVVAARAQRRHLQVRPHGAHEVRWVLAPGEHAEARGIHRVGVDDRRHLGLAQAPGELLGLDVGLARGLVHEKLHEHAPVHRLAHPVALAAVLLHVDGGKAGLALGRVVAHRLVA